MPEFIHDIPLDRLAIWCAVLTVGSTWVGILFLKPFLRLLVGGEANINATIGHVTSVFGLFYGLLMGLLTVAAYQNYEQVEEAVFLEAAAIGAIYADLDTYPEPYRSDLREMMRDYVLFTVVRDWPAADAGGFLDGGANRANGMRQILAGYQPQTVSAQIFHRQVVGAFQEFDRARTLRLNGLSVSIPKVLWYAVVVGAIINIALVVMLKLRLVPHLILGGLSSFFLGVILFVVLALDEPLRGENAVTPRAFEALWGAAMIWDEPAHQARR